VTLEYTSHHTYSNCSPFSILPPPSTAPTPHTPIISDTPRVMCDHHLATHLQCLIAFNIWIRTTSLSSICLSLFSLYFTKFLCELDRCSKALLPVNTEDGVPRHLLPQPSTHHPRPSHPTHTHWQSVSHNCSSSITNQTTDVYNIVYDI